MHRRMKKTFICDESMIITIPIGSLEDAREGQLMPDKFQCVYRDSYKIFVMNGKPKPLGAAQAIAGVFIIALGLIVSQQTYIDVVTKIYTLPSVLFVVSGMLTFAAGQCPNMLVTKLSFSLNIMSLFWSITAIIICALVISTPPYYRVTHYTLEQAISGLIMSLLVVEKLMAIFLIHWLSKAVCRSNFNTLPMVLLKQED